MAPYPPDSPDNLWHRKQEPYAPSIEPNYFHLLPDKEQTKNNSPRSLVFLPLGEAPWNEAALDPRESPQYLAYFQITPIHL